MRHLIYLTTALPILAACGGSDPVDTTIFARDSGDSIQAALVEGKTVTGKTALISAVIANRDTGEVMAVEPRSFSLKLPSGDGEDITINVGGEEVTFTATERRLQEDGVTYYGWQQDGDRPTYEFWSWSNGNAANNISLASSNFTSVWEIQHYEEGESDYLAYAVVGTETPNDVLPGLETATYNGYAGIKAYPDGSYDGFDTVNRLEGDARLTANFGAGTISGAITDLRWGWTGDRDARENVAGQINMEAATIGADGSYSGALSGDAAFNGNGVVSTSGGTYTGDFFGPEAENTAGAIGLSLSADGTDFVGSGFFNTQKDE